MGKGSRPHRSAKAGRKPASGATPGHSGAGRPRKEGERYASGRLKPPAPNARVVAERRALLGDAEAAGGALRAAENPLDLMAQRGWLSREAQGAGQAFARLHARGRMGLPKIRTSSPEPSVRGAQIASSDPTALWRLNEIWRGLAGDARAELINVCVLEAWPAWLVAAARTGEPTIRAALLAGRRKAALEEGLAAVARVLKAPTPAGLAAGSDLKLFADWVRAG